MKEVTSILTTMLLLCFPAYSNSDSQTEQRTEQIEKFLDQHISVVSTTYALIANIKLI